MITGLSDLLPPAEKGELLAAVAEKRPIKSRTSRIDLARLAPWSELNRWITIDTLASGRVRLLRGGRDVPIELVSKRENGRQRVLLAQALHQLCEQGLSIQFLAVERLSQRIAVVVAALERELRADMWANAYASFTRGGALPPHSDEHDVLILQLDGRKAWKGYGGADARPLGGGAAKVGDPEWEEELQPGDLLYLPRGEVHHAAVIGEQSLHLTIGIEHAKGRDSLSWLHERSSRDIIFRTDITPEAQGESLDQRSIALRQALHRLVDQFDLREMLADRDRAVAPHSPLNLGLFGRIAPEAWVSPTLRRRPNLPAEGEARIEANGAEILLDSAECALLLHLLDSGGSRVGALIDGPEAQTVERALTGLIRKSLLFVLED
ncbi:JmjC domain-containing protein [Rhizorhabdus sp. FW153]|uniref:JmjC domain-containing protein n=1 Tax=Rhizorhabdus sp. FW153 TaxID=3400216 RepID=UPI003CE890F4